MKVVATRNGYYDHKRRKEGEEFELIPLVLKDGSPYTVEQQFSAKWMVKASSEPSAALGVKSKREEQGKKQFSANSSVI
jgi:hypothetical protein